MKRPWRWLIIGGVAICIIAMLIGWWLGSGHELTTDANKLIGLGRLAGMVAAITVLLQLLVMSRAPFIENNFDLEELNTFHRYSGYTMVYALVAHLVFLVVGYNMNMHLGLWGQFIYFNTSFDDVLKATAGSIWQLVQLPLYAVACHTKRGIFCILLFTQVF